MSLLGARVIGHTLRNKCLNDFKRCGVDEYCFLGDARKAYNHLKKEVSAGRYPSQKELEERFGITLKDDTDPEDTEYLSSLMKERYVTHKVSPLIESSLKYLESKEPLTALTELKLALTYKNLLERVVEKPHSYKKDGLERIEAYEKAKAMGGLVGIATPWPSLNDLIGGWVGGILHTIVGFTSIGKSWLLSIIADYASMQIGKDECILVVSTEMSPVRIGRRIDCVKYKLKLSGVRDGDLDSVSEEKWYEDTEKALDDKVDYGDIILVGKAQARTVQDILILVEELNPRMVIIDGGYRLESGMGGDWGGQVKVIEDLQEATAFTNIPWIVTSQLGDASETGKGLDKKKINRWNVRYAKEWIISPDIVIGMQQDDDMALIDVMGLDMLKFRDGDGPKKNILINWNKDIMDYTEAVTEDPATGKAEETKVSYA